MGSLVSFVKVASQLSISPESFNMPNQKNAMDLLNKIIKDLSSVFIKSISVEGINNLSMKDIQPAFFDQNAKIVITKKMLSQEYKDKLIKQINSITENILKMRDTKKQLSDSIKQVSTTIESNSAMLNQCKESQKTIIKNNGKIIAICEENEKICMTSSDKINEKVQELTHIVESILFFSQRCIELQHLGCDLEFMNKDEPLSVILKELQPVLSLILSEQGKQHFIDIIKNISEPSKVLIKQHILN